MNSTKRGLSKTTFKTGLNCPRALWLDFNRPDEADEKFGEKASIDFGAEVGELAREYFPGTVLADTFDIEDPMRLRKAATRTAQLMADESVPAIAEATFFTEDNHKCQVDVLKRGDNGSWTMYEVKAKCNVWGDKARTRFLTEYIQDTAFQLYVLTNSGVEVGKVHLMHPNGDYRFCGSLDVEGYFSMEEVSTEALQYLSDCTAHGEFERLMGIVEGDEPSMGCGDHCCRPKCPYLGHCLPEANATGSILELGGMTRKKQIALIHQGIVTKSDLLAQGTADLSAKGKPKPLSCDLMSQCGGKDSLSKGDLAAWLAHLEGKTLYFLDFETVQTAVPRFEGDKPYEQVPTQYSLHIVRPDGACEHREHLAEAVGDPWRGVAEALCRDIPVGAVSIAYNKVFERDRIKAMAAKFPDLAGHLLDMVREDNPYGSKRDKRDLEGLGLVDLIDPFRAGWVYRPAMRGSKSIKWVLPAMFPDDPGLDYHNLVNHGSESPDVQNGAMAIDAFNSMAGMDADTMAATRENLLRYCELDTWAMVKIWLKLRELVGLEPLGLLPVDAPLSIAVQYAADCAA